MRTATTVMLAAAATTGHAAGPNCSRARRAYVNVTATGVTHYRDTELLPWLDGMPGPAYHGALLGRHGGNVRAAVDAHAQPVLRFVARDQSLLDVGCGFCWLGKLLRERRPDVRYAGATVSREQVAHCRALGFEVHAIDFTDAAAVHRALGARRFDVLVLVESLFYLGKSEGEKAAVLERLRDVADTVVAAVLTHPDDDCPVLWGGSGTSLARSRVAPLFARARWDVRFLRVEPYMDRAYCAAWRDHLARGPRTRPMPPEIRMWYDAMRGCAASPLEIPTRNLITYLVAKAKRGRRS